MAAHPIVVVGEDGTVEIPKDLQTDPRYQRGAKLELVPVAVAESAAETRKGDWRRLDGLLVGENWTQGEYARAVERKRLAQQELDRVYALPDAGATELKAAEREWELADDEVDFGPFHTA